ncbi:MAG TPA: efflux RND transporter periplasmic adaptor subunit [Flavobacteriaceae bacterium]|nr:efflux RND transporter periplasmic adaptor subunit [Flavobacteriaceae bacterium]
MKKILYSLTFGLVLLTFSCQKKTANSTVMMQDTIPVQLQKIQMDSVASVFEVSGYFSTDNETPLSFKNGGIVEKIYVKEGDRIKSGQVLAEVKGTETQAAAQQADLAYQKAKRDYERAVNLYKDSVTTLEQMQNAKTALAVAEQQKAAADFNAAQSQIIALTDGNVLEKFVKEGQLVGAGTPVLLVSGSDEDGWIFKSSLSDSEWATVKVGDSARVSTNVGDKTAAKAEVIRKAEGISSETGGFSVQLSVQEPEKLSLASGLFGKATIYPSKKIFSWQIPYDALLDGDADYGYVFVTNDRKTAKKIKIHISKIQHGKVLIDEGLEDAKYLIVSGSAYLKDGSVIDIKN